MSPTAAPLLDVKNLQIQFQTLAGKVRVVEGIDFWVYPGETLGLVGESGCGKSVTAMSILQLLRCPPAEIRGEVLFQGRNLLALKPDAMRRVRGKAISMVFQEPMTSLNPVLTIGEQIAEAVRLHLGMDHQRAWAHAVEMLRRVQIAEPGARARQYPHKLSGGMRQPAMIAIALACSPQLIFADEPTTALDVTIQAQIMHLMGELKKQMQTSIVLITHDMGVVAELTSRVIVMYAGQIVEEAPVRQLFRDPRHPYTRGLLRSIPVIGRKAQSGRRLEEIKGLVPNPLNMPPGCRFQPRCTEALDYCACRMPPLLVVDEQRRVRCWLESDQPPTDAQAGN